MDELAAEERSTQIAIKQGTTETKGKAVNQDKGIEKKGGEEVEMRAILKGTGSTEADCLMLMDKRRQIGTS